MCKTFLPLIQAMDKKIDSDLRTHNCVLAISTQLRDLAGQLGYEQCLIGDSENETP